MSYKMMYNLLKALGLISQWVRDSPKDSCEIHTWIPLVIVKDYMKYPHLVYPNIHMYA